jgi:hypothetical protein
LNGSNGRKYHNDCLELDRQKLETFQKTLVECFANQFDSMSDAKSENIKEGLMGNCETLYIASFNSAKQEVPMIVSAVQYSSSDNGAFISWLGVLEDVSEHVLLPGNDPVCQFQPLGLGMILQSIIQFQQITCGQSPHLLLRSVFFLAMFVIITPTGAT